MKLPSGCWARGLAIVAAAFALLAGQPAVAGGHHSGGGLHSGSHAAATYAGGHSKHSGHAVHSTHSSGHAGSHVGSRAALGVQRDAHGRIARSPEQKAAFERAHPCPSTGRRSGACPGNVVDHVVPLKRGGADRPKNMQWQTKEAAKAKDKTE